MPINLMYHDVSQDGSESRTGFAGPGSVPYKLSVAEFERHLDAIASVVQDPPVINPDPTCLKAMGPNGWMITFDDGGVSAATEIASRLEQRGWRGWFFISTDYLDTPAFCSRIQVKDLHRRGHMIGSHSCSHPDRISACSWEMLLNEWAQSCKVLSEVVEQPITSAAVPGGFYSTQVARAAAQAGIKVLFNSEPTTGLFEVDGTLVLGRFNVYRGMPADDAAALITSPLRRFRQAAYWNLKKAAKVFVGPAYKAIRHRLLSRQYNVTGP